MTRCIDRKRQEELETVRSSNENLSRELAEQKKSAGDRESAQVKTLQERVNQLETIVESEKKHRQVNISVSLKTEERPKAILMGTGQDSSGQPFQAHVTEMSLLVYNQGEKSVVLRACKLWKLHATGATQQLPLHNVATLDAPVCVELTEPLLRAISGGPPFNFTSLQGEYTVRIVITYCEGSTLEDAQPKDFQLTCKPWRGGGTLRIDANEVPVEQP